jgi:hypothetical protein
MHVQLIKML